MKSVLVMNLIYYAYSFLGWIMEVCVSLYDHHKFINRGFLIGPMCPIYGFGGLLITLLLNKYANDPFVLFIMAMLICSVLEYFTSYLMEKIFKNRWWDYHSYRFNINGRICLEIMLPFGILAVISFYIINPFLIKYFSLISLTGLKIICAILIIITMIDLIISFNVIFTLKNISNSIVCDSTEIISKKVREILSKKTAPYRRILKSFPNMKPFNKMSILKSKLENDKEKLKNEKLKSKQLNKQTKRVKNK